MTTEGLQLGYLIPQFPGQTHIFFWREIQALRSRGVTPHLFSTRPPPPGIVSHDWSASAAAETYYLAQPDPVAGLAGLSSLPWGDWRQALWGEPRQMLRDMALSLPAARLLVRHARQRGIEHVHVHSCGRSALIAAMAKRMGGPAYSLTLHGDMSDYGPGQRYKWRHAAFATIITQKLLTEASSELTDVMPGLVAVQAMGVDTDQLSRSEPWLPPVADGPVKIFSCARLHPGKGHEDLLEAIRQLRADAYDIQLTIAGEDDDGGSGYRKALETRIADLGLGECVTLLGAVSEGEVLRQLLATHYFALASQSEPLGVALMEAMSCEVPTIGTAAGGVAELITHGENGVLVPPRSPAAIAEAISGLIQTPDTARRLGTAGRQHVIANFGAARGAKTIIKMIAESKDAGLR